ncbi:hypothetical protein KC640_02010, partial [Candidatus Dojkabacteria bacterium]|nr:hypothetical protein [Candidatus Dojkabacteria bacterium]
VTNGVPFVYSDGYYYYHTARSIVDHGTFASSEKPEYFDYRGHAIIYYNGKYGEVTTPGGALFLTPGLFISKLFRDPSQTIYNDYFLAFNGHTLLDGIMILLTAMICAVVSWVLMYRVLRKLKFSPRLSVFAVATTYASSYAVWYVFLSPAFTHTYELFCMSLVVWGMLNYLGKKRTKYLAALALGLGMLVLLRPIFAVVAVFIAIWLATEKDWRGIIKLALMGLPFLAIWLIYNYVSYGSLLTSGYTEVRGELFTSNFNAHNVLLSPQRGWFVYSPVFALAAAGLVLMYRKYRRLALFSLATISSIVIIYGFWPAWWGGGTFGQRFLILLVPLGAIGLAYLITTMKKRKLYKPLLVVIMLCVFWSLGITLMYRFTPVGQLRPASDSVGNMSAADRYTPIDMISYQLNLIKDAQGISDYVQHLYKSASGGTSLIAILLGIPDAVLRIDEREAGKLQLVLVAPPIVSQPLPDAIDFYLVNADQSVEQGHIDFIDGKTKYVLNCVQTCQPADPEVTLVRAVDYPKYLPREEYEAIDPDRYEFNLFFARPQNMQVAGPPINLSATDNYFVLP